ncbi:MAG: type III glutamate--ammonia ligase [Alphaproteobacteria bacterium]|nr:type III glutamate--ammonia ligase [Alphaproteobacteria bacterium]
MAGDLAEAAKKQGIKYFLIGFTDLFGTMRAKLVPAAAIADMQKAGAGFAGFAINFDMTPAHPDMFAMADGETLQVLPWKPEVGWVAADLLMEGKPIEQSPRHILKRVRQKAAKLGYRMMTGVECEYFLVTRDGQAIADADDRQDKPCYDQSALMRRYEVVAEICDGMGKLGWGPYQNDHEDANGQFEMNWHYSECLTTADRHAFFKFMVKSIAEKHGQRATFMPKPFANLTGSGCHAHVSLWSADGKRNLFADGKGELGLSRLAYQFLGGVLHHADALVAFTNPTVNSYKRINAPVTRSGATWAPNTITYAGNNRTHMVRIPEPGRFELRLPDGAANPYLMQAAILLAGLDGIEHARDPGKRLDIDMYSEGDKVRARRLPLNLLDALRNLEKSKLFRDGFGTEVIASYAKLRMADWQNYMRHLSEWERANTLDV